MRSLRKPFASLCEDSPGNYNWCLAMACATVAICSQKTSYPDPDSLYYSGNEIAYASSAKAAPRGHLADDIKRFTAFRPGIRCPLSRAPTRALFPLRKHASLVCSKRTRGEVVGVAKMIPGNSAAGLQHRYWSTPASYAQIYYAPAAKYFRAKTCRH